MRRQLRSVRFRAAAVATVVVVAALVVSGVALVALTRNSLVAAAEDEALTRARALAELAAAGAVGNPLPGTVSAQLVADDGSVVAATRDLAGAGSIVEVTVAPGEESVLDADVVLDDTEEELLTEAGGGEPAAVAIVGVALPSGRAQLAAFVPLDAVSSTTGVLVPLLALGIPLLGALVAVAAWLLVGRSFRPVEEMRAEAEGISMSDLHRRIPVPQSGDEIARLAATLNSMLERLQSSVARQQRFVADASHELRSPIASLVTMAEVAATAPDTVDLETFANDVGAEAARLALLTDDLLTLARSDEGRLDLDRVDIDVAELIHQEVARLQGAVDVSSVESAVVAGDRLRLGQAIRNLLDNAMQHKTATVWASTEVGDTEVAVVIADDGPGIDFGDRERVFERFERLDEARGRDRGGAGLGLAVVAEIAAAHGGRVAVVDHPDYRGAVLRLTLPR
jgi:signal transduction histidine kinase